MIKTMSFPICNKIGLNQLAYNTMAVRKIKKRWYVDIRYNRKRFRIPSPENSKAGAEAYEATIRHDLAMGKLVKSAEDEEKQKKREQKFKNFAWEWFETYVKTNNKYSEVGNKKYTLQGHLVPFFGETPIDKIDTLRVEQYKAKKISKGLANKTINNHLIVLGTCLRAAQEWFGLSKIPTIKKLKAPPQKFDFLSQEESNLLLAHSNGVWREIILTALKTGLRRGELKALDWSDINWSNKMLTVRRSWSEPKKALDTPKSNRERHILLTDELYKMLLGRKKAAGFVFTYDKDRLLNTERMNHEIRKACKRAGIREITCHILRHTFASHLAMAGAPLKAIQELMGHANIQTTMRYVHLAPSSLKDTIDLLEPQKALSYFGQPVGNREHQPLNAFPNQKTF